MLLAVTASAQSFVTSNVKLDVQKTAVVANGARKAPAKASLAANQRLLGYYNTDDCDTYVGIGTYTTGEIKPGMFLAASDLQPYYGSKVVGVRFNLAESCKSSGVFVKKVENNKIVDFIDVSKAVTSPSGATNTGTWHEVMFDADNQFELNASLEGLVAGYTCTQASNNYPIGMYSGVNGELDIYANIPSSKGGQGKGWYNFGSTSGALAVQLIVENSNFSANAAQPLDFGSFSVGLGATKEIPVQVLNVGTKFSSVDYTITLDGKTSAEKHVDFGKDYGTGGTVTLNVPFEAASQTGEYPVILTITKVNGVANEWASNSATGTNKTVAKVFTMHAVAEQFTGTGCGWCPRGHQGMHNMRAKYGDQFIGIALHQYNSSDPMYNSSYMATTLLGLTGAPSCVVNRATSSLDPYYDMPSAVEAVLSSNESPFAGVTVSGKLSDDATTVDAKATVESIKAGDYELAFMLTGDELSGTTNSWKQANYFSSLYGQFSSKSQLPEDLQSLYDEGKTFFTTFNDVLLASSYVSSKNKATLPTLVENGTVETSYTLTLPTKTTLKNALHYHHLYVVAVLLDPATGEIVNAGKANVEVNPTGIENVNNNTEATVVARYTSDGVQVSAPVKGLNIVKMSDGTTRKVLVK